MNAQLFIRDNVPSDFGKNVYVVCGLIQSDTPLDGESVCVLNGQLIPLATKDVSAFSRGNNLDGVMQAPIWRKFAK